MNDSLRALHETQSFPNRMFAIPFE